MANDPNSVYERFIEIFKTFKYWAWGSFEFSAMTVERAIELEAPNHVIYDPQSTSFDYLPIVTFTLEEDSDDKTVYSVLIYDETENSYFVRSFAADAVLSKIGVTHEGNYYCHQYRKTYFYRRILDHSIDFFNLSENPPVCKNSFKDFHLIPILRPWYNEGPLSLLIASIPDTERRVDISSFLQEDKKRGIPTGEWEFYIDHDKWSDWASCYRALVHYFHGFKMAVRLKDHELDRIYQGRITVKGYTPGSDYSKITLEYQLLQDAVIDPSKLGLCFQAWWLDWNGNPIDYIPIPWGSTPSTSSTDDGTSYGPDPSAAYDNQIFTPDLPVRIEIIQQPSILSYYDGATINYSGISVRAFNSAGDIWSANSKYLSGMIPYSELQFPTVKASFVSATLMPSGYFQPLPVNWPRVDDRYILSSSFLVKIGTIIHHIEVTTPPNKVTYFDGDEIDYTGIVVTAYTRKVPGDSSSELIPWINNGRYPKGIIPIENLIFPVDIAEYDGNNEIRIPVKYVQHTTIDTEYSANFEITVNVKPYRIEVEVPPLKNMYLDGDNIEYDGMIVKAYTENDLLWKDTDHPDGIIPINELILPEIVADIKKVMHGKGTRTLDGKSVEVAKSMVITTNVDGHLNMQTTNTCPDGVVIIKGSYYTSRIAAVSDDSDAAIHFANSQEGEWRYNEKHRGEQGFIELTGRLGVSRVSGKQLYYAGVAGWDWVDNIADPELEMATGMDDIMAADIALYGVGAIKGNETIPVIWKRPVDEQELTNEFEIIVSTRITPS